jgi:twitching motility protein PilI
LNSVPGTEVAVAPNAMARAIARRQAVRCGSVGLLVTLGEATELMEAQPPARLPGSPPWLLGLANLHGHLVPVFDVARAVDETRKVPARAHFLVIGRGDRAVAIVIDALPRRWEENTPVSADVTLPEAFADGVARNAYVQDGVAWFDVDFPRLFEGLSAPLHAEA